MSGIKEEAFGSLIRKLDRLAGLDSADKEALAGLPLRIMTVPAGTHLLREKDRVTECCLLLSGFAFRYKAIPNGSRQILSFHLSGTYSTSSISF
jgi:CRP-like cAMP-binding protein